MSRSGDPGDVFKDDDLRYGRKPLSGRPPEDGIRVRRDDLALHELNVNVSVSYKTLVVIFALFTALARIIDGLISLLK